MKINIEKFKEDLISNKETDKYQILYQWIRKEKISYQEFRLLLQWIDKYYYNTYIN